MWASVLDACIHIIPPIIIPVGSRAKIEIGEFPYARILKSGIAQQVRELCLREAARDDERQTG